MPDDTNGRSVAEIKRHPITVTSGTPLFDTGKFEHMQRVATAMAQAKLVPQHLQGSPGDCLMIVELADRIGVSPFMLAQKTYIIQGKIAYEAQLIAAMVNTSPLLEERLRHSYEGKGGDLVCIVKGRIRGEAQWREKRSPRVSEITVKNSPLWKVDPEQQLLYWTQRAWGRANTPELLLGLYSNDEMGMIDVTPRPQRQDYIEQAADETPAATEQQSSETVPAAEGTKPKATREQYEVVDAEGEVQRFPSAAKATSAFEKLMGEVAPQGGQKLEDLWEANGLLLSQLRETGKAKTADALVETYRQHIETVDKQAREAADAKANGHAKADAVGTEPKKEEPKKEEPKAAAKPAGVPWVWKHEAYPEEPASPLYGGSRQRFLCWVADMLRAMPENEIAAFIEGNQREVAFYRDKMGDDFKKLAEIAKSRGFQL